MVSLTERLPCMQIVGSVIRPNDSRRMLDLEALCEEDHRLLVCWIHTRKGTLDIEAYEVYQRDKGGFTALSLARIRRRQAKIM